MAQEDKGLVLRGLFLLAFIGILVTFVIGFVLWRQQPSNAVAVKTAPENLVVLAALPNLAGYPASVSWLAVQQMADTMPSDLGWQVRYNAAVGLARRGSDAVPWAILHEMLDENCQKRNYVARSPNGQVVYDDAAARANMIAALGAVSIWHEKQKAANKATVSPELRAIYAQVDRLTESPFVELKNQATKARSNFFTQ